MSASVKHSPWMEDEAGYTAYLEHERHMFAWCFVQYGAATPPEAMAAAELFYPYEPATDAYRGLVFHDEAWHWAMLRIVGDLYWKSRPELQEPSSEYRAEAQAFDEAHNA